MSNPDQENSRHIDYIRDTIRKFGCISEVAEALKSDVDLIRVGHFTLCTGESIYVGMCPHNQDYGDSVTKYGAPKPGTKIKKGLTKIIITGSPKDIEYVPALYDATENKYGHTVFYFVAPAKVSRVSL